MRVYADEKGCAALLAPILIAFMLIPSEARWLRWGGGEGVPAGQDPLLIPMMWLALGVVAMGTAAVIWGCSRMAFRTDLIRTEAARRRAMTCSARW